MVLRFKSKVNENLRTTSTPLNSQYPRMIPQWIEKGVRVSTGGVTIVNAARLVRIYFPDAVSSPFPNDRPEVFGGHREPCSAFFGMTAGVGLGSATRLCLRNIAVSLFDLMALDTID